MHAPFPSFDQSSGESSAGMHNYTKKEADAADAAKGWRVHGEVGIEEGLNESRRFDWSGRDRVDKRTRGKGSVESMPLESAILKIDSFVCGPLYKVSEIFFSSFPISLRYQSSVNIESLNRGKKFVYIYISILCKKFICLYILNNKI